jgi:pimeloyl-ACP methyl ester carboxylesterase
VALHNYRHKLGAVPGMLGTRTELCSCKACLESKSRPSPWMVGSTGVLSASDGSEWSAYFLRHLEHRVVAGAGHNIPQEQPRAFAEAVLALMRPDAYPCGR